MYMNMYMYTVPESIHKFLPRPVGTKKTLLGLSKLSVSELTEVDSLIC